MLEIMNVYDLWNSTWFLDLVTTVSRGETTSADLLDCFQCGVEAFYHYPWEISYVHWLETTRGHLVFGGKLQSWIDEHYPIEEVVVLCERRHRDLMRHTGLRILN